MEEQILKIIRNHFYDVNGTPEKSAKVIATHVMEFIEWLSFDGLEIFIMTGKAGDNKITWFDSQDGENTLEEVYNYWLTIKNK